MNGKGTTADGPITANRVQISTNPQKSFASRSLRRKQIAGLVKRVSQHFNYGPSKPHASVIPTGSNETLATQSRAMSLLQCATHNRFMTVNQLPEEQRHAVATSVINMVRAFGRKV